MRRASSSISRMSAREWSRSETRCFCIIEGSDDNSSRGPGGMVQCGVRIAAVVLAAGRGQRAGGPKALLRAGPVTFLERAASLLARPGVGPVIVALGHEAARVRDGASLPADAIVVVNEAYD